MLEIFVVGCILENQHKKMVILLEEIKKILNNKL